MAATQQMSPAQMNYLQRKDLIQNGLHMVKKLQPVSAAALGGEMRIPLERMGIMTGIMLDITMNVNISVAATASQFAPYSGLPLVTYTDYAGLQRVNTNGYQLHALNCFRGHRFANNAAKMSGFIPSETGIDTDILNLPTAVNSATTINFSIFVPTAYDPANDLRGAVLAQTIYGDHYVTLTLPQNLVGTDPLVNIYTAGTVALTGAGVVVQAYQHYIMPQGGTANLPMIDLSTIYAIEGNYNDNSNIVAGQSKYVNWPNNRAIMSAQHIVDQGATGGVLNGTDVNQIVLLGNSNTNLREMTPRYLRNQMRYNLGSDLASGVYQLSSRTQPITTQLYGNVQTRFDMATAAAGTYILSQYESTYLSGTPLPGVVQ